MLDLTKPAQTREGTPVRLLATDLRGPQPVLGTIVGSDGRDHAMRWSLDGRYHLGIPPIFGERLDLVNVPEKHVRYVNFYENGIGGDYKTKARADQCADRDRWACVRIEFTAGQFDD